MVTADGRKSMPDTTPTTLPQQPDRINDDSRDLPAPRRAARVTDAMAAGAAAGLAALTATAPAVGPTGALICPHCHTVTVPAAAMSAWTASAIQARAASHRCAAPAVDPAPARTTPPQGDRTNGDDHAPQTPAQPAAQWEHWDADGDSITIRPLGRHLLATTTNYGPSDVGAAIDLNPDAAASLHAWLGTALGQPAPSTPDAAEPGPQDIPAEWMRAILHDATTLDDLDVADTELLTHHRAQGYRTAIRTAYGVGYASALGYAITVKDDLVLIGDRPEPTGDATLFDL
jgi:hypothetical protein